jgi:hypothetical protein
VTPEEIALLACAGEKSVVVPVEEPDCADSCDTVFIAGDQHWCNDHSRYTYA